MSLDNPYHMTGEEKAMLDKDWKKQKKKKQKKSKRNEEDIELHLKHTVSSKNKKKLSDDMFEFL